MSCTRSSRQASPVSTSCTRSLCPLIDAGVAHQVARATDGKLARRRSDPTNVASVNRPRSAEVLRPRFVTGPAGAFFQALLCTPIGPTPSHGGGAYRACRAKPGEQAPAPGGENCGGGSPGSGDAGERPAGGAGTASGCRIAAIASTPSTSRGPGRTTRPSASIAHTWAPGKRGRRPPGPARPRRRGGTRTASPATTSGLARRRARPRWSAPTGRPGWAATGSPPAARDQVGTQCPARERRVDPLDHRHPGPGPAGDRRRDRGQPGAQAGDQRARPAPARRPRSPTARIVSSTSSRVYGSSDSTSARQPR